MNKFAIYTDELKPKLSREIDFLLQDWATEVKDFIPSTKLITHRSSEKILSGPILLLSAASFKNFDKESALKLAAIMELFHSPHQTEHLQYWLEYQINELAQKLDEPDLMEIFLRYALEKAYGNHSFNQEIVKDVLKIKDLYAAKTGAFTFCLPLVLGYTLANNYHNLSQELILEVIGENLGIILESRTDLIGFSNNPRALRELRLSLLKQKPSLWSGILAQSLNTNELNFFQTIWKTQIITDADLYYLRYLYQKHGVASEVRRVTETEAKLCHKLISDLDIDPSFGRYWHSLVEQVATFSP